MPKKNAESLKSTTVNHKNDKNDQAINKIEKNTKSDKSDKSDAINHREINNKLYAEIIQDYGKIISPSPTYIKLFLDKVVDELKELKPNSNKPNFINTLELAKTISKSLPKNTDNEPIIGEDEFLQYVSEFLIVKSSHHHYYEDMASCIAVQRLHRITSKSILHVATLMYNNVDKNGDRASLLSDSVYNIITQNHEVLQAVLDQGSKRDFLFDYFGIKTLERSYLSKLQFTKYMFIERPQHLFMRVSLGIHGDDITSAIETYHLMSLKYFVHATPTLFNAGTRRPQMSSCFLQSMDDSIESIFSTITDLAYISKWAGGIGVHLTSIRARGSLIRKTNGLSDGLVPLCVLLNKEAKYINQGGKRKGSFAIYLEPWHADIFEFCELRLNTGNDDNRARDLFLALWTPSLFIERVRNDEMWSLMCPDECPGLNLVHGEEFNRLYEKYEKEKKYRKQVKARDLWKHILISQFETGFPYMLYKDHANAKSNQKNLGTIRSSNLCAEIIQYSDENETAVCNLASICLPMFVIYENGKPIGYDYKKLIEVCRVIVRNINKVIDINYYPTEKAKRSNLRHRPIGVGVQGLADLYNIMGYAFDSEEASVLNKQIFETMYYGCLDESKELAKRDGKYETFDGSPFSKGLLQFHLWNVSEDQFTMGYDWKTLIEEIKVHGTRNSLLTTVMPTATTSQIHGNSECIEPYMSNIFTRSTLAGQFIVVNKNLMKTLINLKLWSEDMRKRLIINNGSVQSINEIPDNVKNTYKTAFEIKQKQLVRQSADRGIFIDQSQSLNIFMKEPNFDILTSVLFDGHDLGLKTGMYYYRTLSAVNPISFGIDIEDLKRLTNNNDIKSLIHNNYNIQTAPTALTVKEESKETNEEPKMCKWKPGMRLEDCLTCGS